jgi:hypothetical protein
MAEGEGIVVFLHIRKGFGNLPASVLLFLVFLVFPDFLYLKINNNISVLKLILRL